MERNSESLRTLHFTTPGLKSQLVGIAPDAEEPLSKRYNLLTQGDDLLDSRQKELDESTKARNREFQDRLDEVWKSTNGYEGVLKIECKEAAESILDIKEKYEKAIAEFDKLLQSEISAVFDKFDNELIMSCKIVYYSY